MDTGYLEENFIDPTNIEKINVLSLFDGMSCGHLALKRANIKVNKYFASEVDKHAIKITQKNFPNTIQLGDITQINGKDLPKIDLMLAGSPCQSFSRSGDNSGFNGKSNIFWQFIRLLKECKPRYFLLENVVMKKEWEQIITKTLKTKPIMIDSKYVSAQKRQRLYWTNIPNVTQPQDKNIRLRDILIGEHTIINDHPVVIKKEGTNFYIRNATKQGYLIANEGDSVNLEVPKSKTRRGRVGKDKTNTLNTACNYGTILNGDLVKLNISEYERLQNLPIGYTKGVSESQRKKMIGNGWTVDIITHILTGINYIKHENKN